MSPGCGSARPSGAAVWVPRAPRALDRAGRVEPDRGWTRPDRRLMLELNVSRQHLKRSPVRARGRRRIAMTMQSAGQPDGATRRAARRLAMLAGAFLVPALVAQALFLPAGNREISIPITVAIGLALLASLWTIQAEGPWRLLVVPVGPVPKDEDDLAGEMARGDGFHGALGIELLGERILESGEFLVFVVADDEVARGESVAECVLGDAGFAFGGVRSGGVLGVGLVCGELGG